MASAIDKEEMSLISDIRSTEDSRRTWQSFADKDEARIKELEDSIASAKRSYEDNMKTVRQYEEKLNKLREELAAKLGATPPVVPLEKHAKGKCKVTRGSVEELETERS